jgi:hypothetical protein
MRIGNVATLVTVRVLASARPQFPDLAVAERLSIAPAALPSVNTDGCDCKAERLSGVRWVVRCRRTMIIEGMGGGKSPGES